MSDYDRAHVQDILDGDGDWFTAKLLRLIAHADLINRAKLKVAFPEEVFLVETHLGIAPTQHSLFDDRAGAHSHTGGNS